MRSLAIFGMPAAHEDDAERAVLCALAMQQAIGPVADEVQRRHGTGLAIRVGVNTGEVVSGSWDLSGGSEQADVSGDAVNTAARIEAAADPGGVLVGAETMRLTRRRIRYGEERLLTLKGKSEPVPGYPALVSPSRWVSAGKPIRQVTPLVGRERELAQPPRGLGQSNPRRGTAAHRHRRAGCGQEPAALRGSRADQRAVTRCQAAVWALSLLWTEHIPLAACRSGARAGRRC
jgi:Adenylate and Guanylate cyclase catalytic domain